MTASLTYENAPLVEVIAEMHWDLRILDDATGTRIDPYYYLFQESFIEDAAHSGFKHIENVVPRLVPLEHSADQPRLQLLMGKKLSPKQLVTKQ